MRNDEIEKMLSVKDEILPSSGFAASVMDAVRREALTPAPIPFPWIRAMPGLAAVSVVVSGIFAGMNNNLASGGGGDSAWYVSRARQLVESALHYGAGWIAVALLLSLASVVIARRVAMRRI